MITYIPIIVTYNRKKKLIKSIGSLLEQTIEPKKIIIIDNHSNDGTQNLIYEKYEKDLKHGLIEYHYLNKNLGGSGGFYTGVKAAQKYNVDYISLADDDAFYRHDYFEKIFSAAKKNLNVKAFQGIAFDKVTNQYNIQGKIISNWDTLESKSIDNVSQNILADVSTFVGFTLKKEIVDKIGLPVNNFFIWNDDTEYSLRMHPYTSILQVKDAVIEHIGTQRDKNMLVPLWKTYYGFRNAFVLRKKYSKNKFIAYTYTIFLLLRQTLATIVKTNYNGQRFAYIHAYWNAYLDALTNKLGKNRKYLPEKNNNHEELK